MSSNGDPITGANLELRDDESFRRLFDRYYPPVLAFFANRGISAEDCKDLAQETFIRVYRGWSGFRNESSFATWVLRIAANTWRNALRHRSAAKRAIAASPLSEASQTGGDPEGDEAEDEGDANLPEGLSVSSARRGPLEEALAQEKVRLLREAVAELPPRMRQCVALHVYQGLNYREIAAVLGLTTNAVKSHIHQARARLATAFPDIRLRLEDSSW